eukprot:COSAG01_NODE_4395_length_5068_cov_5.633930_4_plen_117_part_00
MRASFESAVGDKELAADVAKTLEQLLVETVEAFESASTGTSQRSSAPSSPVTPRQPPPQPTGPGLTAAQQWAWASSWSGLSYEAMWRAAVGSEAVLARGRELVAQVSQPGLTISID